MILRMAYRIRPRAGLALSLVLLSGCGGESIAPDPDASTNPDASAAVDAPVAVDTPAPPTDAGGPVDTGGWVPDASSPDTAIEAPADTWTWVPFPDSACGNGTPAGIGVNLRPGSRKLVIFLMGGGGCWDAATCLGLGTATHIQDDYTASTFRQEIGGAARLFLLDRANMQNPMRDANLVYVPYCTGDIHGGDRVQRYNFGGNQVPVYHVGARNLTSYLRRLVRTLPNPEHVVLTGSSAGGFGAGIHWWRVADAWPGVRVDLVDDSGPPVTPPAFRWTQWQRAWNLQLPPGCPTCSERLESLVEYYTQRFRLPSRMALLSYLQDRTISGYFSVQPNAFETQLRDLGRNQFAPSANARYFFQAGSSHVLLGSPNLRGADGTTLGTFLQRMLTNDPAWQSVGPE